MLKNQRIAQANPNVNANREFVNALFLEKYGRLATDAEFADIQQKYPIVRDVAKQVLGTDTPFGEDVAPFSNEKTQPSGNQPTGDKGTVTEQIIKDFDVDSYIAQNYPNLSDTEKRMIKDVYSTYAGGITSDRQAEILKAFNKISAETINPYYKEQTDIAKKVVERDLTTLNEARALETEQERIQAQQNIEDAQQNLEDAGLTFGSKAVKALGGKSAYKSDTNTIEGGIPFGGAMPDGTVNVANRLMSSSSLAKYRSNLENIGRSAESKLGTDMSNLVPGYSALGVTKGSIKTEQEQAKSSALSNLMSQEQKRNELLRNKNYFQ